MASLEYEKAKAQYWQERSLRQEEFARTDFGKQLLEKGGFHEAFARLEKPHVKKFTAQQPESRRAEAAVRRAERLEDRPMAARAPKAPGVFDVGHQVFSLPKEETVHGAVAHATHRYKQAKERREKAFFEEHSKATKEDFEKAEAPYKEEADEILQLSKDYEKARGALDKAQKRYDENPKSEKALRQLGDAEDEYRKISSEHSHVVAAMELREERGEKPKLKKAPAAKAEKVRAADEKAKTTELARLKKAKEPAAIEAGPRGGKFYRTATGQKVYVK
jgi:tetratricopeptide (TPR) repeat protein